MINQLFAFYYTQEIQNCSPQKTKYHKVSLGNGRGDVETYI